MGCGASNESNPHPKKDDTQKPKKKEREPKDNSNRKEKRGKGEVPKWFKSTSHTDYVSEASLKLVTQSWNDACEVVAAKGGSLGVLIFEELDTPGSAGAILTGMKRPPASLGKRFEIKFKEFITIITDVTKSDSPTAREELLKPINDIATTHTKHGLHEYHYAALWKSILLCVKKALTDDEENAEKKKHLDGATRQAWRHFFSYLSRIMITQHRKEAGTGDAKYSFQQVENQWGDEAKLLQYSFAQLQVTDNVPEEARKAYYTKLFHKAAHLRPIFDETEGESACGFFRCLKDIIEHLPDRLPVEELAEVGARHSIYGVRSRDYTICGEVLLDVIPSMEKDTPVSKAWVTLFRRLRFIMSIMTEGRRDSETDEFDFDNAAKPKTTEEIDAGYAHLFYPQQSFCGIPHC